MRLASTPGIAIAASRFLAEVVGLSGCGCSADPCDRRLHTIQFFRSGLPVGPQFPAHRPRISVAGRYMEAGESWTFRGCVEFRRGLTFNPTRGRMLRLPVVDSFLVFAVPAIALVGQREHRCRRKGI